MNVPIVFRIVFAVLFGALALIVVNYRRTAQAGREIDSSIESRPVFFALRAGGLALWAYCILIIVYPKVLGWSFFECPDGLRWAGAALVAMLIPLVDSSQKALGRNVSPTVVTFEDHELVTDGPYKWIRNPLYSAGAGVFTGLGLLAASWFLITLSVVAVILVRLRLPQEEAELEDRFGSEYRDYCNRTGRFLPRIRRAQTRK
ncbi:MAG: isoprenylcysteine carboxylmethyltransferase family protein [Rhodothermales bacterium]|nr:isoprenylcysteine carboxylmethyltransferase family protein [Rhodothermales bacterium]